MKRQDQWSAFFTIEKNIPYQSHLRDTKELSQLCWTSSVRKRNTSLSFGALVRTQLRFMAWKIWFFQGMILAALCSILLSQYADHSVYWIAVTLPRFLCLCSGIAAMSALPLLRRSSRYQMMELEQSTRFSLSGALAAQLLFIGIGDLWMLVTLALIAIRYEMSGATAFLSLVIPFLTLAVTCLMLWVRTSPSVFRKAALPFFLLTILLMNRILNWYRITERPVRMECWILYTLLCLGMLFREYRRIRFICCNENML